MFGKKKTIPKKTYDKETQRPVLHCSICTGEQVAGFKHKKNGSFEEVMLIRNAADLDQFVKMYDLNPAEITKEY